MAVRPIPGARRRDRPGLVLAEEPGRGFPQIRTTIIADGSRTTQSSALEAGHESGALGLLETIRPDRRSDQRRSASRPSASNRPQTRSVPSDTITVEPPTRTAVI